MFLIGALALALGPDTASCRPTRENKLAVLHFDQTAVRHQHGLKGETVHCGPDPYLVAEICEKHGLQETD